MVNAHTQLIYGLNALTAGLVLLAAFGMVTTRQVQGVLRFLIVQSLFVAASAFLIGFNRGSIDLLALGCIMIASKVITIPWVLRRMLPGRHVENFPRPGHPLPFILPIPDSLSSLPCCPSPVPSGAAYHSKLSFPSPPL